MSTVTAVASATPIVCPRRPPGDGQPQRIIVWSKAGGDCAVRVYRPEGRICRRVWDGHLMPNEIKTLFWDSADEAGQSVASGVYIAVFQDGNGAIHKARMAILR